MVQLCGPQGPLFFFGPIVGRVLVASLFDLDESGRKELSSKKVPRTKRPGPPQRGPFRSDYLAVFIFEPLWLLADM
jgi:hypothetical protein